MAGRGRGATLPAWMTQGGVSEQPAPAPAATVAVSHDSMSQFADSRQGERQSSMDRRKSDKRSRSRSRDGEDKRRGDDRRSTGRDRDRGRDRDDRRRGGSPDEWKPRKNRQSNFDMRPAAGLAPPPIGVSNPNIPNSCLSFTENPMAILKEPTAAALDMQQRVGAMAPAPLFSKVGMAEVSPQTKHARRLYAGGIPPHVTEIEIRNFFNDVIQKALGANRLPYPPVINVYINLEKSYAFIELPTIELATACMKLDGITWEHPNAKCIIRVRRPSDYRPELVAHSQGPVPELDMNYLIGLGVSTPDGPGRIFVGGLPYGLGDDAIVELLSAFGPLKSFHQVREGGANTQSKGYGFCEYYTKEISDLAISGLNGMQLGDKTLSVRYANVGGVNPNAAPVIPASQSLVAHFGIGGQSTVSANNLLAAPPTKVLKMSNMLSRQDLVNDAEYEDIKEDVRLECMDYGRVISMIIPRVRDGYQHTAEGNIYVEFASVADAAKASAALNGRKFDNKTVIVNYYDEMSYARRVLN